MLNGWIKSVFVVACAAIFASSPVHGLAQVNSQSTANQQGGQYTTPRLTPEQQAAQQRAAMESRTQQQRAQQDYAQQATQQNQPNSSNGATLGVLLPNGGPQQIIQPKGFPLAPAHADFVDKLLSHWENNSKQIEKYKCGFRRYDYDRSIVEWRDANNRLAAHSVVMGQIRFAAPERAHYETTQVLDFVRPPQQPGAQADYLESKDPDYEKWICDGKSTYQFDFKNSRLLETKIPVGMQGNVAESPLPFIFGAEKKAVMERYWVRYIQPTAGIENEYWLELFPKRASDAQNYSKIELIIAREDFLPKAMHIYSAQYNPAAGNETSRYFAFENREVNNQLTKLGDFLGVFIKPRLPFGWTRVILEVPQGQPSNTAQQPGLQLRK